MGGLFLDDQGGGTAGRELLSGDAPTCLERLLAARPIDRGAIRAALDASTGDDPATVHAAIRAGALLGDSLAVIDWSARLVPDTSAWTFAVSREVLHASLDLRMYGAATIELDRLRILASPPTYVRLQRKVRTEMGRFEEILADDLARFRQGDLTCLLPAIKAMTRLRDRRAMQSLVGAEGFANLPTEDSLRVRIAAAQLAGDHRVALRLTRALCDTVRPGLFIADLARAAAAAGDEAIVRAALDEARALWADAPQAGRRSLIAVLATHYAMTRDGEAITATEDMLVIENLDPVEAQALGDHLSLRGRDADARRVIAGALALGRSTPRLWTAYLGTFWRDPDTAERAVARARMADALPGDHHLRVLSAANHRALATGDIAALVAFNLREPDSVGAERFFQTLRHIRIDPAALSDAVAASGAKLSPQADLTRLLFQAWVSDAATLAATVLQPTNFHRFQIVRRELKDALRDVLARLSQSSGNEAAPRARSVRRLAREYRRLLGFGTASRMNSAECYADAMDVLRLILDRVAARQPLSLIRLGDGEGNFLPYSERDRPLQAGDQHRVMTTWWGDARPDPEMLDRLTGAFRTAVSRADILGVTPIWRGMRAQAAAHDASPMGRGCIATVRDALERGREAGMLTSAHVHHDLQVWNLWRELFARVDRVSWVSCHDLGGFLWETHGVATRRSIRISPENRYGQMISAVSPAEDEAPLFERHDEICAALRPEPGEVWLIAAGWLGKIYCDVIRSRGGIGIDIGSMADYWVGLDTRAQRLPASGTLNLDNILLRDALPPATDERTRIVGRVDAVRSSTSGRVNVAGPQCAVAAIERSRERYPLRAIGHPRCASGYVAALLNRHGMAIGHERLLDDGIVSWMYAVRDARLPYGDSRAHVADFDHTLVYVRDPREALPSIMLENGIERSFDFRRQHILRACGIDIREHATALDRAAASYLHWYDIAFAQRPDAVIRVEDAETALPVFLANIGRSERAAVPIRVAHRDRSADTNLTINASSRKFGQAKPILTEDDFDRMATPLRERLDEFCRHVGYGPVTDVADDPHRVAA